MMRKALLAACLVPFLMGNNGGCETTQMPTMQQIQLHLPQSIRECKYAPKSPGMKATNRQKAEYLVKLYDAWKECHGDLATVNRLYEQWLAEVNRLENR